MSLFIVFRGNCNFRNQSQIWSHSVNKFENHTGLNSGACNVKFIFYLVPSDVGSFLNVARKSTWPNELKFWAHLFVIIRNGFVLK